MTHEDVWTAALTRHTIADTGAGMAPELLPRVFDLFVQSEQTLDRAQGGLGIGLAIVKLLMGMHDGDVSARSAGLGLGSAFELRLPLIAQPASAAVTTEPSMAASETAARQSRTERLAPGCSDWLQPCGGLPTQSNWQSSSVRLPAVRWTEMRAQVTCSLRCLFEVT